MNQLDKKKSMQHVVSIVSGVFLHQKKYRNTNSLNCRRRGALSGRAPLSVSAYPTDPTVPGVADIERIRESLQAWKEKYNVCIIPKSVKGEEAQYLSMTMKALRRQKQLLSEQQIQELEEAGMIWSRPNTVESKWFANFHTAREYVEEQRAKGGLCEDFLHHDQETYPFKHETRTDLVEASRWLHRQRELYRKQKLTLLQVHLIKRVLGVKLTRQYSPTRRNKHPVLRQRDEEFLQ